MASLNPAYASNNQLIIQIILNGFEAQIRIQVMAFQPSRIIELGLIFQAGVTQDRNNRLPRTDSLGITNRARQIDAR